MKVWENITELQETLIEEAKEWEAKQRDQRIIIKKRRKIKGNIKER